ncbi:hypothetical protein PWT90_03634 [Aphanocladium album]|nr:hypothetical protein PWT90_03634 [Aphanocladium album]
MLSVADPMADSQFPGPNRVAIPRPQVGIDRLPPRRQTNEPRESMNCKSCRKRKIKCNRLRPSCEACQLFQCPCIYDAVPKKRGPKTDVLEALLKRVDGLEAKLKEKNAEDGTEMDAELEAQSAEPEQAGPSEAYEPPLKRIASASEKSPDASAEPKFASSRPSSADQTTANGTVPTETLINAYFATAHGRPYFIVDESAVRQRMQLKQLPQYLVDAMCATVAKFSAHPNGHMAAVQMSLDLAVRARRAIDVDELSVEATQALLLVCLTYIMAGKGAKAYMVLNNAIAMAVGLELHREMDAQAQATLMERETRRRLFWTCYQLDRLLACGSKRPGLISDDAIILRLPSWSSKPSSAPTEGEFFHCGSNLQYLQGSAKKSQGASGMFIDICRILGITSKYLAAGGVKGDSHFPWHSLSNLSKIRQDLDTWASGTNNAFATIESLFGQSDAAALFLSKMIYHLIHCLIYRPFLPIDLAELSGNGQHQSWQIEATTMCFLHANAITELADLAKQTGRIQMPGMTGYCIFTAATVHVHGTHYAKSPSNGDMAVFLPSSDLLTKGREMLSDLRYTWSSVEQHRENLEEICVMHGELVKALASNSIRYTPGFQLENYFDRYSDVGGSDGNGRRIDGTSFGLKDVSADFMADPYAAQVLRAVPQQPSLKRKSTGPSQPRSEMLQPSPTSTTQGAFYHNRAVSGQMTDAMHGHDGQGHHISAMRSTMEGHPMNAAGTSTAGMSGYSFSPAPMTASSGMTPLSFSPTYNYSAPMGMPGAQAMMGPATPSYDPMFGAIPTNAYGSPATWHGNHTIATVPSPSTKSNTGSTGTQGDEKDPFMTLLEQLAQNEQRFNNGTGELDFFLAGAVYQDYRSTTSSIDPLVLHERGTSLAFILLALRRCPARAGLHDDDDDGQKRSSVPHAPNGPAVALDGNLLLLGAQLARKDKPRRAQQPRDEARVLRRQAVPAALEPRKARRQRLLQEAEKDAAANRRAEAAAEAAKRAKQARADVLGVPVRQVQHVREAVVERGARRQAVEEDDRHKERHRRRRRRHQAHEEQAEPEDGRHDDGRQPKGARAPNVQRADQESAHAEARVGRDQHGAGAGRRGAPHGEHEDGRVEEQRPPRRHEPELRQARQQHAARRQDGKRDDGVRGHAVLDEEEGGQGNGRQTERERVNVRRQTVEEHDNGEALRCAEIVNPRQLLPGGAGFVEEITTAGLHVAGKANKGSHASDEGNGNLPHEDGALQMLMLRNNHASRKARVDQRDEQPSASLRRQLQHKNHTQAQDACAARARDGAADDQAGKGRCARRDERADGEQNADGNHQVTRRKYGGQAPGDGRKGRQRDEVRRREPGRGGVRVNVIRDLALDHGHARHVGSYAISMAQSWRRRIYLEGTP